jgi:hypothetical protein
MQSTLLPARRRVAPVVTLLILAPVIAEVLFGSTPLTRLVFLIPQIGAYGCGALIIRALVRSQGKGWTAILLLGIAYSLAEECVILQTSLYPLFAPDPQLIYGRALGVNWIYLLWALGYESVWSIILPIQLTELLFPDRRDDPWLGKRGLSIAAIFFLLASLIAWYSWTHLAVPSFYPSLNYQTPWLTTVIALMAIAALAAAALGLRPSFRPAHSATRAAARPWVVALAAFVTGLLWFGLLLLHYGIAPSFPAGIPAVIALAAAFAVFSLVRYWSAGSGWQDSHRLAIIVGASVASMLAGFWLSGIALPIDLVGKLVFNVIAVLGLCSLAWKIQRRKASQGDA